MLDYIYLIVIILWVGVLTAYLMRDVWLMMFVGLIMMSVAVFTLFNGFAGYNDLSTTAFSFFHLGTGLYLMIKSLQEVIRG